MAAHGKGDAVGWPRIDLNDFPLHDFVLRFEDQAGVENLLFESDDDGPAHAGAEAEQGGEEEIVGEGAWRGLVGEYAVDRGTDGVVDVEDDDLVAVAQENGAAGRGRHEGDGFDADEIRHCGSLAGSAFRLKARVAWKQACAMEKEPPECGTLMLIAKSQWILRGEPFHPDGDGSDGEFPLILRHLIEQRGLPSGEKLEGFLRPQLKDLADPFEIGEMEQAVARILQAVDAGEKVLLYGDYDVDGVSSIAVMRLTLEAYGLKPRHFIPRRSSEGYGLSLSALERCMAEGDKPDLLIAVDCGTVSVDEIARLRADGVDVIVVDHHEPGPRGRPDVVALVNPKCGGGPTYLCAAGVCFKLAHALMKTRRLPDFDLKPLLEMVTLATVADIVPMVGENRLMVRHGLLRLPQTLNPGLKALQEVCGMNGRATSLDIGFRIGPRLNAAGRMDVPEDALGILLTDCRRSAHEFAQKLEEYNRRRQTHENRIRKEALDIQATRDPSEPVIVLGSRDWHPGVVGIVASRLMRQFHKPTFIVAIDEDGNGKGSGRSIEGVSLVGAIHASREHLLAGGGHDMAAGISVREEKLDDFRAAFAAYVLENTSVDQRLPRLYLDAEIPLSLLSLEFLKEYELLQPFGNGNPQPVFMARRVHLASPPLRMKNHHLRLVLRQGFHEQDAVFFNGGEIDLPDPPWDVAFTIDRNHFRGRTSLQVIIQDVRASIDD